MIPNPIHDPVRLTSRLVLVGLIIFCPNALAQARDASHVKTKATAHAIQASDGDLKVISDLVHAEKYKEAQQLTASLLKVYPDDSRLIKARALLDKLLAEQPVTPQDASTTDVNNTGGKSADRPVSRGYLGVNIQSVTPDIATSLGVKDSKGAIVVGVVAGGPAAKAGFEQGDIVTAINGQAVEDAPDLTRKVASVPPGQAAVFSVLRQGNPLQVRVTIAAHPDTQQLASNAPAKDGMLMLSNANVAGLDLSSLTPEARKTFNIVATGTDGAVITKVDPGSDAANKGLQPGDVVHRVGNRIVRAPADFQIGVAEAKQGGRSSVLLLVAHGQGGTSFVAVDIDKK